jgi:hypothetical protein
MTKPANVNRVNGIRRRKLLIVFIQKIIQANKTVIPGKFTGWRKTSLSEIMLVLLRR